VQHSGIPFTVKHSAQQHDEEAYAGNVMASMQIMMAVKTRLTAIGWRRWRCGGQRRNKARWRSEVVDAAVDGNDEEKLKINYHLARDAAVHYS
jgi:hypothetical protein